MVNKDTVFYIPPYPECRGIGDHLQFSRLPECNFNKFNSRLKLCVDDKYNIWKTNPFVEEMPEQKGMLNLWKHQYTSKGNVVFKVTKQFFDITDTKIKPIIYADKSLVKTKHIAISTEGSIRSQENWCRKIPEWVSNILANEFSLVQFGGTNNYKINQAIDLRGLSVIDSYMEMTKCSAFIGINSGFMHVANAAGIPSFIYLECPVELPISANDLTKYPTNEWLYDDNTFFSQEENKNVLDLESAIRRIHETISR